MHKKRRGWSPVLIEELELRQLLSAQAVADLLPAYRAYVPAGSLSPLATSGPQGFTPSQIRNAYGINQVTFGALTGDGSGQTIAIIAAYNDPSIRADLHAFDLAFGLPDPTLTVVGQDGSANLPNVDPSGPGSTNWAHEIALDVEWSHAIAPAASILLVEANDASPSNLYAAANWARQAAGVSVVSMSFGGPEAGSETLRDSIFTTPATHPGVTFIAASGDAGAPGGYPAYSPNVVAAGGTSLVLDSLGNYQSETGWSSSGGGISTVEAKPSYQNGVVTQSATFRANPDVSFDAAPSTGVSVYDSYDNGVVTPWTIIGGTSLAAPAWAGIIAIANQGRVIAGAGTLDGRTQTLPLLYSAPATDFHDITSGNNGFAAAAGYDLVTGRGSPRVNLLVGYLVTGQAIAPTTAAVSASVNPSVHNQTITLTATISSAVGTPTGNVTFKNGATVLATVALDAAGHAQFTLATLPVGSNAITVDYAGATDFAPSTSSIYTQVVNAAPTATAVSASINPSLHNQSITLTATVNSTGGTPTGNVTFKNGATALGTVALDGTGHAQLVLATLPVGSNAITVDYAGETNFAASTSSIYTQFVNASPTATTVSASVNPSAPNQTVTLTATVTSSGGTPNGDVTFKNGATVLGALALNGAGEAQLAISTLPVGSNAITVDYAGVPNFAPSTSSTYAQVVSTSPTTTTVSASLNPSASNQSITLTATVTGSAGTPTGNVTFKNGATLLGIVALGPTGQAQLPVSTLPLGSNAITAAYAGVPNFAPSTSSTFAQLVNPSPTTTAVAASVNPSAHNQSITLNATVTSTGGTPTGNVTFKNGTTVLGIAALGGTGQTQLVLSTLPVGNNAITVEYAGGTNFAPSTSPVYIDTVNPDASAPQGFLIAHDPSGPGGTVYQFQVKFTDNVSVLGTSLTAPGTVLVTGPNGFSQAATFVSVDQAASAPALTATYQITVNHGATWSPAQEGAYTVTLANGLVSNTGGLKTAGGLLGQFFYSYNPLFSERYYLTIYPDIKNAITAGSFTSGYAHYLAYGQKEGRNPSSFFDEAFYLKNYPLVAQAVTAGQFKSGFDHFVQHGAAAAYQPSLMFNQQYYLLQYPAVAAAIQAGTFHSALEHFMISGQYEGYNPSIYFNTGYYLAHNADVAAAIANGQIASAFEHFVDYGLAEGRNAIAIFDETWYLANNPDVAAAVGAGVFKSGYAHYITNGQYEATRVPSPLFNTQFYLTTYPDVAAAVADGAFPSAFFHYLWTGQAEGRLGHA